MLGVGSIAVAIVFLGLRLSVTSPLSNQSSSQQLNERMYVGGSQKVVSTKSPGRLVMRVFRPTPEILTQQIWAGS